MQLVNLATPGNWQHPLNRGLVGWYLNVLGDNRKSRAFDLVGKNHGTLTAGTLNATSRNRNGGYGAWFFDGTDDYILTDYAGITTPTTMAAWVNVTSLAAERTIFGCASTSSNFIQFRVETSGAIGLVDANEVFIGGSTTGLISAGVWSHVVASYDASGNYAFYVNGTAVGSGTNLSATSAMPLSFGVHFGTAEWFAGYMDDMRHYSRILTASEVTALYRESRLGYPTALNWIRPTYGQLFAGGGGAATRPRSLLTLGCGC